MELEFVLRVIIVVAGFVIPAFIVSAPSVLLGGRWSKTRLIGLYILIGMISYILGFLGAKFGIFSATIENNPLSFLFTMILTFTALLSFGAVLYFVFEPVISKIRKISWKKIVAAIILVILIVAVVLPLIPGVLFAFGIKTENWPVKALHVEPAMVTVDRVTLSGIEGTLLLAVQNSNLFPTTISKIDVELYSTDGTLIATGSVPHSTTIPPGEYKIISCNFKIPWVGGGKFIYDKLVASLKGKKLRLKLRGYVYIDLKLLTVPVPFSKVVEVV